MDRAETIRRLNRLIDRAVVQRYCANQMGPEASPVAMWWAGRLSGLLEARGLVIRQDPMQKLRAMVATAQQQRAWN